MVRSPVKINARIRPILTLKRIIIPIIRKMNVFDIKQEQINITISVLGYILFLLKMYEALSLREIKLKKNKLFYCWQYFWWRRYSIITNVRLSVRPSLCQVLGETRFSRPQIEIELRYLWMFSSLFVIKYLNVL